ncbi:MAG: sigma-70 family RNA polymerase sigma factor [Gammaproteobacteria bacterium]|nr:sigma-70 family RNA polymerase sigma factor [Gammaproteobacteria bacterium]
MVKKLIAGNEEAFIAFFNDYFPRLYRFAMTRLKNDEDDIRDIVQATLTNAIRSMATYRGEAALFTWLCQICRNEINGHLRRKNRDEVIVAEDDSELRGILETLAAPEVYEPGYNSEKEEIKRMVQVILDYLPPKYGNALEWKYIEGCSVNEIAEKLLVTPLAAQSILSRARTAFRDAIESIVDIQSRSSDVWENRS